MNVGYVSGAFALGGVLVTALGAALNSWLQSSIATRERKDARRHSLQDQRLTQRQEAYAAVLDEVTRARDRVEPGHGGPLLVLTNPRDLDDAESALLAAYRLAAARAVLLAEDELQVMLRTTERALIKALNSNRPDDFLECEPKLIDAMQAELGLSSSD